MHGKHSRMVFIPLYRNTVCYYGIDSRKCATRIYKILRDLNIEEIQRDGIGGLIRRTVTRMRG
jgi:hypothetical protein